MLGGKAMTRLIDAVVFSAALSFCLCAAEYCAAQEPTPAQPSDAPKDELALEYANTYLKLVENEQKRVDDIYQRLRAPIPGEIADQLHDAQAYARARQEALEAKLTEKDAAVEALGTMAETAKNRLARAEAANKKSPGAIPALRLERLKLSAQLADLRLKRARSLGKADPAQWLAWQVEQLRDDLAVLNIATAVLRSRN